MGMLISLIVFLAIGAGAGWAAGQIMGTGDASLVRNIVIGIIGAVLGGFLFSLVGLSAGGLIGSFITATVGAVVLLFIVEKVAG